MVTAFITPLVGAWKGAAAAKAALMTATAAASHLLPHSGGEAVDIHHGHAQDSHGDHADHGSHADPADHGDHGHDEQHHEHEDHEEHEHDDHEHEEHEHEHEEEGDEMEETVEAAEFAHENGAASGAPFWRSFQKRSQSHAKPTPDSASATNAEAVLKAVAAAAAVASVTSRMVESRCQELGCRPVGRNGASATSAAPNLDRVIERDRARKPWRLCGDPFPNPAGQLPMVN